MAGGESEPSVAAGSAPLFWAQVAGNTGLLVGLIVITRALGPAGRGTVAFLTVTSMVVGQIARFGVTEATTVFAARRPQLRSVLLSNVLLSVTIASMGAGLLVCGGLWALPGLRPQGVGSTELWLLGAGLLFSALTDAGYMFALGCSRFHFHASVTIASAWLHAGVVAVLSVLDLLTVNRAVAVWAGIQGVKAVVLLAAAIGRYGLARPQLRLLLDSAAFGLRAWIGSLSVAFNDRLDQVLVALIASEATLGVYAVAVNASEVLFYLPAAAATAILPLVARAGPDQRGPRTIAAFRSVMLVTVGALVLAAVAVPPLLPLVFGDLFHASASPFLWLLPGVLGYAAMSIFTSALVASEMPGRSSAGPLVSLVTGVTLDVVLIPRLGAEGAAIAASCALLAGGATSLALYRRHAPFPLRALLVPRADDLQLLSALRRPFSRRGTESDAARDVAA